eukprot:scaffold304891_cov23-Tisochrysis_lutea.AAC.1
MARPSARLMNAEARTSSHVKKDGVYVKQPYLLETMLRQSSGPPSLPPPISKSNTPQAVYSPLLECFGREMRSGERTRARGSNSLPILFVLFVLRERESPPTHSLCEGETNRGERDSETSSDFLLAAAPQENSQNGESSRETARRFFLPLHREEKEERGGLAGEPRGKREERRGGRQQRERERGGRRFLFGLHTWLTSPSLHSPRTGPHVPQTKQRSTERSTE